MVRWKTIPVKPETHAQLTQYKMGPATYDDVLTAMMEMVPLEKFMERYLARLRAGER